MGAGPWYVFTPVRRNDPACGEIEVSLYARAAKRPPSVFRLRCVVGVVDPGLSAASDRLLGHGEEQSAAPGGEAADEAARERRLSPT